jgi:tetratricopeptide (TPR) repeat protein
VDDAAALAQRVLAVNKGDRMARLVLAVRAIKQGQYPAARREIAQGRGATPDPAAALLSAWTQASPGEARSAINSIDRLNGPDWYAVFKDLQAALMLDLVGRRNDALKRFERAYGRDPTALRAVQGYASLLFREGRSDEALTMLAALEQSLPRHPFIVEAIDDINAGREPAPLVGTPQAGAAEALYGLGEAFGQRDGEDLGLVYLQLALYLEPSHALALLALGDLYENLGRHELAIKSYERVAPASPLLRKAQIEIAVNLGSLDRIEEAKSRLEQLIAADPRDLEALSALGTVLRNGKQFTECAEAYSRGIATIDKDRRSNWTIYYFRGICFERSNQWPKAEADFKKALALNPEQPHVLNYLGYSWIDQGLNLEEGMSMIRRALAKLPNDGYFVDSLGWAYFRLGYTEEALKQIERAAALKPDDPTIQDHLGDIYLRMGREAQARKQWARARALNPDPDDLIKIEAKLASGSPQQQSAAPAAPSVQQERGAPPPGPVAAATPGEPAATAAVPSLLPPDSTVAKEYLGLELGDISNDLRKRYKLNDSIKGVVITGIHASSPAADKPLAPGNVIIEMAEEAVGSVADFRGKLDRLRKQGEKSALLVVAGPDGGQWFVSLSLAAP